jgi:hypothetical protein
VGIVKNRYVEDVKKLADDGKIAGIFPGVTSEDFCSVCGKPENNMYIFDGEQDIPPHCDGCFGAYMQKK